MHVIARHRSDCRADGAASLTSRMKLNPIWSLTDVMTAPVVEFLKYTRNPYAVTVPSSTV